MEVVVIDLLMCSFVFCLVSATLSVAERYWGRAAVFIASAGVSGWLFYLEVMR